MDPFVPSNARFYRTPLFGGMADGLKIKVKRKNNNKFMIKIKKSRYFLAILSIYLNLSLAICGEGR